MTTLKPRERAQNFVAELRRSSTDRGKMAALRRALSPRTQMDAWPVLADLGGEIERAEYATIAALYALHPEETDNANFGATCRQIGLKDSPDATVPESSERRFRRLLAADSSEELGHLLRAWIRLAASKGAGVNYEQLFTDLWNWDRHADDIRVLWAAQFWPARKPQSVPPAEEQPA